MNTISISGKYSISLQFFIVILLPISNGMEFLAQVKQAGEFGHDISSEIMEIFFYAVKRPSHQRIQFYGAHSEVSHFSCNASNEKLTFACVAWQTFLDLSHWYLQLLFSWVSPENKYITSSIRNHFTIILFATNCFTTYT